MYKNKKKLLFITKGLGLGGAQKAIVFVANVCAKEAYDVTILSLINTPPSLHIEKNIKVIYAGHNNKVVKNLSLIKNVFNKLKLIMKIRKAYKEVKPDLAIVFMADIVRIVMISLIGLDKNIIGSERGNPMGYSEKQKSKYAQSYQRCNAVVFQTERAAEVFKFDKKINPFIIPNPSIPRLKSISPYFGERRKIIAAAGRLHEQKRFDVLISAFEIVVKKYPNYHLHIYGEGDSRKDLESLISEKKLSDAILLKGQENDVFEKVYDNSMFVLSSDYEGIPNVLIEALSIGMPCISTDCDPGGPRLLFNGGKRGLLVPVGNVESLAKAICTYIENPELASEFGKKGIELNKELAPDVIGQKWINVIESNF